MDLNSNQAVDQLMTEHKVTIKRATTKYNHTHTAFVENFNKQLAKKLFLLQDVKELHNPTQSARSWIKYLQSAVDHLNNDETQMIGMKPIDAIKLKRVKLYIKPYPT